MPRGSTGGPGFLGSMRDRSAIVYELGLLAEIDAQAAAARGDAVGSYRGRGGERRRRSWIHGPCAPSASSSRDAEFEDGLEDGRALSLEDAVALALGRRYLTRSIALNPAGMTPNSAKASSQGCASAGECVANEVRLFAITLASMGVLREDPCARGVVLVLIRPDGSVLDSFPEPGDEVRVDVGSCHPGREQADLRAHGVEGIGETFKPCCSPPSETAREGRRVDSPRSRADHLRERDVLMSRRPSRRRPSSAT